MAAAREDGEAKLPLLPPPAAGDRSGVDASKDEAASWWRLWAREAGRAGYLALPMVVVSFAQYVVQVSSNMMVGHLPGVLPLSAAAMATSLANVTGFSLLWSRSSFLSAMDHLEISW
nr:unnamed protein product [Digitaria exilis]